MRSRGVRWKLRQWWLYCTGAPELGARVVYIGSWIYWCFPSLVLGRWDLGSWRWTTALHNVLVHAAYRCCCYCCTGGGTQKKLREKMLIYYMILNKYKAL
jgi:hypothetical protein